MVISERHLQLLNMFSLISVIEEGIVTWCIRKHPQNIDAPIVVTDEGMSMNGIDAHLWKAHLPISVTDEGIVISVIEKQLSNAHSSILVTDEGMFICINDSHPLKQFLSIDVIPSGSLISVSQVQSSNAESPISMFFWLNKISMISRFPFRAAILIGVLLNRILFEFHLKK